MYVLVSILTLAFVFAWKFIPNDGTYRFCEKCLEKLFLERASAFLGKLGHKNPTMAIVNNYRRVYTVVTFSWSLIGIISLGFWIFEKLCK